MGYFFLRELQYSTLPSPNLALQLFGEGDICFFYLSQILQVRHVNVVNLKERGNYHGLVKSRLRIV